MTHRKFSRRQFLGTTITFAGAALLPPVALAAADKAAKRTAADQVTLGKTGLKLSRLGIGTGSNSGEVQRGLGREGFNKLLRYAYDQGITYIDTAQSYHTHDWIRGAIKGLPREKLFIQTKMPEAPEKPLEVLDRYRQELGVDYLDSVLSHFAHTADWPEERKRVIDAFEEAKQKQIIRAKGVSCHGMPALRRATELDWVDVHLVRINPQGRHMDGAGAFDHEVPTAEPMKQITAMRAKGRGMIGMKIIGNGEFTKPEDREKSIRFAMQCGLLDAVVIGFASTAQIDEAIERINRALAEA
jgi:predicted aldo/keto reductase-like oxidoreductase